MGLSLIPPIPIPSIELNSRPVHRLIYYSLALLFLCSTAIGSAGYITFPADVDWVTRRSEHFEVLYRRGQNRVAERALIAAERAHTLLAPIFPDHPRRTYMVLADFRDSLNGYAFDYPFPHFVVFVAPPGAQDTLGSLDDWLGSVILHEYVHVLHLYPARGIWKLGRWTLGNWVLPVGLLPAHQHEGLATFFETEFAPGGVGGRGRGSDFLMYRRLAVKEGKWGKDFAPFDLFEGSAESWPHGSSPYFFGYWTFRELWKRKGAPGIRSLVEAQASAWPYWVSQSTEASYGVNYPDLWSEIYRSGEAEANAEIRRIEKNPLSPVRFLTETRYNKSDVAVSPSGDRAIYRSSRPETGSQFEMIALPDGKRVDTLDLDLSGDSGICWLKNDQLLSIQTEAKHGYYTHRLRLTDLETKRTQWIPSEFLDHAHALSCVPQGALSSEKPLELVVYAEFAGRGWIRRVGLEKRKDEIFAKQLGETPVPEGVWVTSVLHDGEAIYWLEKQGGKTTIVRKPLDGNWQKLGVIEGELSSLQRKPKGASGAPGFWAIGDMDGRNEIWEISLQGKIVGRRVSVLGGIRSFAPLTKNSLAALNYRHGGYDLAIAETQVGNDPPPVTPTKRASFTEPAPVVLMEEEKEYSALSSLYPRAWFPNLLVVPDGVQVGAFIPGFDIAQRYNYLLFGGYDTRGSPFLSADISRRFNKTSELNLEAYYSPLYLIQTKDFLRTWGGALTWSGVTPWMDPKLRFGFVFRQVENSASGPQITSPGFMAGFSHSFGFKSRPRAVAPHRGVSLRGSTTVYLKALGSQFDYTVSSLAVDQYWQAPWRQSHIWFIGLRLGFTEGSPLYNYFFQGGGEILFTQGRGFFLNRGFAPGAFLGRRMATLNIEYRFPIAEIERGLGLFPVFLNRIHGSLIGDIMTYDSGTTPITDGVSTRPVRWFDLYYGSVGAELKTDWKFGSYLPATLRFGAYHGVGQYGIPLYLTMAVEASFF